MSEKIYACFLRLYPVHFRETYGDEAMQLFRDRCGDERGLFPRLRLWLDLLIDLFTSIPQEYRRLTPELVTSSERNGYPAFGVLEGSPLPIKQLFAGGLLSLFSFLVILFAVGHGGRARLVGAAGSGMHSLDFWQSLAPRELSASNSSGDSDVVVLGNQLFGASAHTLTQTVKSNALPWNLLVARNHSGAGARSGSFAVPAGQAFWAWFSAFNSGDPKALENYVKTVDPSDTVNAELHLRRLTGGFHLQEIVSSEPVFIRVLLRDKATWTRFLASIRVADDVAPRVVSFCLSEAPKGSRIEEIEAEAGCRSGGPGR